MSFGPRRLVPGVPTNFGVLPIHNTINIFEKAIKYLHKAIHPKHINCQIENFNIAKEEFGKIIRFYQGECYLKNFSIKYKEFIINQLKVFDAKDYAEKKRILIKIKTFLTNKPCLDNDYEKKGSGKYIAFVNAQIAFVNAQIVSLHPVLSEQELYELEKDNQSSSVGHDFNGLDDLIEAINCEIQSDPTKSPYMPPMLRKMPVEDQSGNPIKLELPMRTGAYLMFRSSQTQFLQTQEYLCDESDSRNSVTTSTFKLETEETSGNTPTTEECSSDSSCSPPPRELSETFNHQDNKVAEKYIAFVDAQLKKLDNDIPQSMEDMPSPDVSGPPGPPVIPEELESPYQTQFLQTQFLQTQFLQTQFLQTQFLQTQFLKKQFLETQGYPPHENNSKCSKPTITHFKPIQPIKPYSSEPNSQTPSTLNCSSDSSGTSPPTEEDKYKCTKPSGKPPQKETRKERKKWDTSSSAKEKIKKALEKHYVRSKTRRGGVTTFKSYKTFETNITKQLRRNP